MLQFLHVSGPRGRVWAVRSFSLEVKPGEIVHLSGPTGSGKSLLIRMAMGSVPPAGGTVFVNGMNPYKTSAGGRQGIRRVVSAVLDDEPVLDMPADAWVALGMSCAGKPWKSALGEAREAIDRCGLGSLATTRVGRIPRGLKFPLSLLRGLVRRPHLLLIDWAVDDGPAVPEPLKAEFAAFVAGSGACLVAGEPGRNAVPAGGRVEALVPPGEAG